MRRGAEPSKLSRDALLPVPRTPRALAFSFAPALVGCSADDPTEPGCTACDEPVAVTVGEGHACALTQQGRIACWGANESGQLGQGHTRAIDPVEERPAFVDLGASRSVMQVAAGPPFTCALRDDTPGRCWGQNGSGRFGQGATNSRGDGPAEMGDDLAPVLDASGQPLLARAIAAGQGTACVIDLEDRVRCWGNNSYGQLGPHETNVNVPRPTGAVDVGTGVVPKQIEIGGPGGAHRCHRLEGSRSGLKCWGYNGVGALGRGNIEPLGPDELGDAMPWVDLGSAFGPAPDQARVAAIALGHRSSCALSQEGAVKCWGYGKYGLGSTSEDLGNEPGEMGDALEPVPLGGAAVGLFAGGFHFCAILKDQTVHCWGRNDAGQLGLDATGDRGVAPGDGLGAAIDINRVTGGAGDELASCVLAASELRCWGGGVLGGGLGEAAGEMAQTRAFVLEP